MMNKPIEEIMSEHALTVEDDVNVGAVAHLLMRYRINGILVVKRGNKDNLVGIITTTDLLTLINGSIKEDTKEFGILKEISRKSAGEIASKNIISVQKDEKVFKVLALMQEKNVHTIPVYNKDKLVGVVGKHDILNAALF